MWHMGDGWGWWMLSNTVMFVGFWALVIWAVIIVARGSQRGPKRPTPRDPTPLEILERRYASGEITDDEFETRRRRLLDQNLPKT